MVGRKFLENESGAGTVEKCCGWPWFVRATEPFAEGVINFL